MPNWESKSHKKHLGFAPDHYSHLFSFTTKCCMHDDHLTGFRYWIGCSSRHSEIGQVLGDQLALYRPYVATLVWQIIFDVHCPLRFPNHCFLIVSSSTFRLMELKHNHHQFFQASTPRQLLSCRRRYVLQCDDYDSWCGCSWTALK